MKVIAELVAVRDQAWFAGHPGVMAYLRPLVPEELLPGSAAGSDAMLVRQLAPGVLTCEPLSLPPGCAPYQLAERLGVEIWCANCREEVSQ